jgi:hypothetical protein
LIRDFSEATTGHPEDVELETLSSSIPTVALIASVPVILAIAKIVEKFLDAWKKVEEIREIRGRLAKMGLKHNADALTEQITTTVDTVVEESTEIVISSYTGEDGRRNELRNAIRQHSKRLFGQIERGLTIEFRAQPDESSRDAEALKGLNAISRTIQFPDVDHEPVLLTAGEIIEDEITAARRSKKTTTTRTTTREKKSDPNQD